jgi:hypothetical protein
VVNFVHFTFHLFLFSITFDCSHTLILSSPHSLLPIYILFHHETSSSWHNDPSHLAFACWSFYAYCGWPTRSQQIYSSSLESHRCGEHPPKRAGRPRKLSARDETAIARIVSTATAVQHALKNDLGVDVHRNTVARSLKLSGLWAISKVHKPLLTTKHRKARLAFAKKYRHWTVEDWKRVFFSDETKINRGAPTVRHTASGSAGSGCVPIISSPL